VIGNPYQFGMVTVAGQGLDGEPITFRAYGDAFLNSTWFQTRLGGGTIQFVSPSFIRLPGFGLALPFLSTLRIDTRGAIVPEPATALLVGAGLCALAAVRRAPRR
jgi:hypothetical protein